MSKEESKIWVNKKISVLLPKDGYGHYQDIFAYLAKVVETVDPKYRYIIGLLNTCYMHNGAITDNQTKLAEDIISYFRQNNYFKEGNDE